jgi:streptomycin 3"-adenylyltransferase
MTGYAWAEAPRDVRKQVEDLASGLTEIAGETMIGIYLHGSLALGCFNPELSDVDILAVASRPLELSEKRRAIGLLAETSGRPSAVEFHQLDLAGIFPWRYPTPFDFHYGDVWRNDLLADLPGTLERQQQPDPDLAAHLVVARERGIALAGEPVATLPEVPWVDYVDSLLRDLEWSFESEPAEILYRILSPARIWATLATGEIHSKDSGAAWALGRLPVELRPVLERALGRYRGEITQIEASETELAAYRAHVEAVVRASASRYARS